MLRTMMGFMMITVGVAVMIFPVGAQMEMEPTLVPKAFLNGNDWRSLSKGEQQAYAVGVVDGLDLASAQEKQGINLGWINTCVTGMSSEQVRAMLKAEIDANPGEWNLFMVHQAMYRALKKSCQGRPDKAR